MTFLASHSVLSWFVAYIFSVVDFVAYSYSIIDFACRFLKHLVLCDLRSIIKIPARFTQYVTLIIKWTISRMSNWRAENVPVLYIIELALCHRRFNCSAAQKYIGYSPVVSLEVCLIPIFIISCKQCLNNCSSVSKCSVGTQIVWLQYFQIKECFSKYVNVTSKKIN